MTNLEKIDCAIETTLKAHPDYEEIMADVLMKKVLEEDPLVTAKFFSRAGDARAHMMEVSDLDLLAEIIKNAVKVAFLLEEKGFDVSSDEKYLDGSHDDDLFGETACMWIREQLEQHPDTNMDDLLAQHPEILPLLVSVFREVRYQDSIVTRKELDHPKLLKKVSPLLKKIERDILVFYEAENTR